MTSILLKFQMPRPRRVNRARRPRRGFTLVEMLVAMGIAGFMIGLFYFIFNEASQAVSRGVQTSDIITKARAFQRQLQYETKTTAKPGDYSASPKEPASYASRMLGPKGAAYAPGPTPTIGKGGVLVIVNHAISGVYMNEARAQANQSITVRSDQLMFMYDQGPASPANPKLANVAPSATNTYGADRKFAEESNAVRVWYGHVEVLPPNAIADTNANIAKYDLGKSTPGSPNRYGAQWVLGRQAMFLRNSSKPTLDEVRTGTTTPPTPAYPNLVYAETSDTDSTVSGLGPRDTVRGFGGVVGMGFTDLTEQTLDGLSGSGGYLDGAATPNEYHARVLGGAGSGGNYTGLLFDNQRLRIIGDPRNADGGTGFEAKTIARMHPYFLEGVSDFIVDWAADYVDNNTGTAGADGKMDRNSDGSIRWYNRLPQPQGDDGLAVTGRITYPASTFARDPDATADYPVTYPPPSASPSYGPGGAAGPAYANGGAMVWGNAKPGGGGAQSGSDNWPFLIRIRYRVHDDQGRFSGRPINEGYSGNKAAVQQEFGRWFQVILPVNRQP